MFADTEMSGESRKQAEKHLRGASMQWIEEE